MHLSGDNNEFKRFEFEIVKAGLAQVYSRVRDNFFHKADKSESQSSYF